MTRSRSVVAPLAGCLALWLVAPPGSAQDPFQDLARIVGASQRSIDGSGNNARNPDWGRADTQLVRMAPSDYADGFAAPAGADRPDARDVSNGICAQDGPLPNGVGASDFVWQWGQFLDHDIDLTPLAVPAEPFDVPVPTGDPFFDPNGQGGVVLPFTRSAWQAGRVREQMNAITAFVDGSNVYGSDAARARALRTLDGTGRLRTSAGDLLPFNGLGLPNAPDASARFFLGGDERANEQVGLTAMHTLFVREHNHWADRIRGWAAGAVGPDGEPPTGDDVYQMARALVVAELQAITYREFLPVLLGAAAPGVESTYDPALAPMIRNEFSTACYRFGHSMLPNALARIGPDGQSLPAGDLPLAAAFFAPRVILDHGVEPLLRGLASREAQAVDVFVVDGVRNFLFGPPGAGGLDLPALNIQRGRDHGVPSYVDLRVAVGLSKPASFSAVTSDPVVLQRLVSTYASVDDLDAWVGGLAEDRLPDALVGPLVRAVLTIQFTALRDGDAFWYRRYLTPALVTLVERQTLAAIIRRNTAIGRELQDDVFRVARG